MEDPILRKRYIMKKFLIYLLVAVISSAASIIVFDMSRGNSFPEGVERVTIHSNILKEDRDLIVRLPPNYNPQQKYPVMYVLDGSSEDAHIADKLNTLSAVGHVPETIVVGIPNMSAENRQRNLTPPFMRLDNDKVDSPAGEADTFLTFVASELIPFIEKNYSFSSYRMLLGNSRGGLLVIYSLIKDPSLFDARFCFSTPVWRQNDILISKFDESFTTNDTLNTFLYMSAGEKETDNIKGGLTRIKELFHEKNLVGFTWHATYTPNATHQTNARLSAPVAFGKWGDYIKGH
jgi:predicted alpha/beta superfamily hydrolase